MERARGAEILFTNKALVSKELIHSVPELRYIGVMATGYNIVALPLAAGVLYKQGLLLSPAAGAVLMTVSTIVVAVNASMLKVK